MNTLDSAGLDAPLLLSVAEGAARSAGALLRQAFWKPRHVTDKGVNDLVTESDRASEQKIVALLHATFPTMSIIGEEGAHITGTIPYTWWIDPLDGTYNFVHSVPRFSVSIACVDEAGEVIVGVVYDPMFDECFCAAKAGGATRNGESITVSQAQTLRDSLAASGFPADLRARDNNTQEWAAFVPRCQGMCRMGSAALDLCYVAAGRFDLYWEYGLSPWDMAAGVLIAREAGGQVTDYVGQSFNVIRSGGLLASNGLVHAEALSVFDSVHQTL
jgi:myo-inositol-1(or 4)-monophosphatase